MKINWNFLGGGGCKTKKASVGGVWIFSGTVQCVGSFSGFMRVIFYLNLAVIFVLI